MLFNSPGGLRGLAPGSVPLAISPSVPAKIHLSMLESALISFKQKSNILKS